MSDGMLECEKKVGAYMEAYIDFLHFQSGIGSSLAGGVLLIICLVNWLMGSDVLAAILSIGLSIYWVYCTYVLRRDVYSALGDATSSQSMPVRSHQFGSVTFFLLKVIDWLISKLYRSWRKVVITCFGSSAVCWLLLNVAEGNLNQLTAWLTILIMGALPFIVWRFLHSPIEVFSGYFLTLVCVGSIQGRIGEYFSVHPQPFLLVSLMLIPVGVLGHWNFLWIKKRFAEV